jgi:hypothetical protein
LRELGLAPLLIGFDFGLKGAEFQTPKPVDPLTQRAKTLWIDLGDAPIALGPVGDKTGLAQDFEMLRAAPATVLQ